MVSAVILGRACKLLENQYNELGRGAAERLRRWCSGTIPYAYPDIIEKHLENEKHIDLLFDAFWQVLPFGTGGRRGRVGYGFNRLNPTTVAMTVQGHCHYLRTTFPNSEELTVVVANDVRRFDDISGVYGFLGDNHPLLGVSSRSLGRLACEIYVGNGIRAYFADPEADEAVMATPELSYLIHRLKAVGGINLSASHNPPDDNGVKVYDQYGSQPVAPHDQGPRMLQRRLRQEGLLDPRGRLQVHAHAGVDPFQFLVLAQQAALQATDLQVAVHPGRHLLRIERLGDVVHRAQFQAPHLVAGVVQCGEEDHQGIGGDRVLLDAGAGLETVQDIESRFSWPAWRWSNPGSTSSAYHPDTT